MAALLCRLQTDLSCFLFSTTAVKAFAEIISLHKSLLFRAAVLPATPTTPSCKNTSISFHNQHLTFITLELSSLVFYSNSGKFEILNLNRLGEEWLKSSLEEVVLGVSVNAKLPRSQHWSLAVQ